MYAVYHGPDGLRQIALRVHRLTRILASGLQQLGVHVVTSAYVDTLTLRVPGQAAAVLERARKAQINLRPIDADHLGLSLDETSGRDLVRRLWQVFGGAAGSPDIDRLDREVGDALPKDLQRTSTFLEHPVFGLYHSETEMLRYLRRLQEKDLALDRSMIPLGSCTMKLNATTEMLPITWRGFSALHPFVPLQQAEGYRQLFDELEAMLREITGFDAVSLQPNAGSQGEYAGLLVIRRYHAAHGEGHRDVCLIPSSAHGTNPASAIMAGLRVVVVGCDPDGNVDLEDLRAKAAQHRGKYTAIIMMNQGCFTMHNHARMHYPPTQHLGNTLMAQTDAENRQMAAEAFDYRHGNPGFVRSARTRRDNDTLGRKISDIIDANLIVAINAYRGTQLTQVLHQIVGKRVIIIDHQ
jgi:glycine dehydrogenase